MGAGRKGVDGVSPPLAAMLLVSDTLPMLMLMLAGGANNTGVMMLILGGPILILGTIIKGCGYLSAVTASAAWLNRSRESLSDVVYTPLLVSNLLLY